MDRTPALIVPVALRWEGDVSLEPLAFPLPLETIDRIEARRAELVRIRADFPDVREIQVDIDVEMCNLVVDKPSWKKELGKQVRAMCTTFPTVPFLASIEEFRELPWRFHESAWLRLREDGFTLEVKANASPNFPPMRAESLSYGYLTIAALVQKKGERGRLFTELADRDPALAAALLRGEIQGVALTPRDLLASIGPESLAPLLEAEDPAIRELAMSSLAATRRAPLVR